MKLARAVTTVADVALQDNPQDYAAFAARFRELVALNASSALVRDIVRAALVVNGATAIAPTAMDERLHQVWEQQGPVCSNGWRAAPLPDVRDGIFGVVDVRVTRDELRFRVTDGICRDGVVREWRARLAKDAQVEKRITEA